MGDLAHQGRPNQPPLLGLTSCIRLDPSSLNIHPRPNVIVLSPTITRKTTESSDSIRHIIPSFYSLTVVQLSDLILSYFTTPKSTPRNFHSNLPIRTPQALTRPDASRVTRASAQRARNSPGALCERAIASAHERRALISIISSRRQGAPS